MPAAPRFPPPRSLRLKLVQAFVVDPNARLYRWTGGRLGGKVKGAPVLLLDHVGRKTGRSRTAPVIYLKDGDDLVIVASRSGSDAMPAWFLNLKANPGTTVQVGRERRAVRAREATAEEKERLWPRLVEMFPDYDVYRRRTEREIPVVILSPPG
jgi:F420H(2)-dependent quinone reductase